MVNNCCSLTVTASASQTAVCVGQAVTLATSISGNAGAVTYFWTGPNGFTSNAANPTLPAATSATAGIYTVTVSDPTASTSCVKTATVTLNVGSLYVVATSNSPVCTTGSLSLTGIAAGGSGSYTYAWTGPNGFVSAVQNPTLALSTTAQSGNYNLLVTDTQGCSGTATTAVVVATQPNLTVTGSPSQTICSGQSTTLIVAGSNGAPVSWTNSLGQPEQERPLRRERWSTPERCRWWSPTGFGPAPDRVRMKKLYRWWSSRNRVCRWSRMRRSSVTWSKPT